MLPAIFFWGGGRLIDSRLMIFRAIHIVSFEVRPVLLMPFMAVPSKFYFYGRIKSLQLLYSFVYVEILMYFQLLLSLIFS